LKYSHSIISSLGREDVGVLIFRHALILNKNPSFAKGSLLMEFYPVPSCSPEQPEEVNSTLR
jgi:hypothetical protein